MHAVVCDKYGPPEVLRLTEIDKPIPKDHEVRIKIYATTVHVGDTKIRAMRPGMGPVLDPLIKTFMRFTVGFTHPRPLGMELSGEVDEVGRAVTAFKKGDQVFCSTGMHLGAYAEYVCLPDDNPLVKKPVNMTHEEAATVPNGATTALVILFAGLGAFLVGALLMLRRLLPLQRKVRLGLICGHCGHQLAPGRNASACPECGYHRVQGRFVGDDAPKGD